MRLLDEAAKGNYRHARISVMALRLQSFGHGTLQLVRLALVESVEA